MEALTLIGCCIYYLYTKEEEPVRQAGLRLALATLLSLCEFLWELGKVHESRVGKPACFTVFSRNCQSRANWAFGRQQLGDLLPPICLRLFPCKLDWLRKRLLRQGHYLHVLCRLLSTCLSSRWWPWAPRKERSKSYRSSCLGHKVFLLPAPWWLMKSRWQTCRHWSLS